MLYELSDLIARYQMRITGIIHLGAHLAEEAPMYARNDIDRVVWVEGNPDLIGALGLRTAPYGHRLVHAVLTAQPERRTFYITNETMASSIYDLDRHVEFAPDMAVVKRLEVDTQTLDSLAITDCNFLAMDLQGGELEALHGGIETLKHIDYIYTEVCTETLYQNQPLFDDVVGFLATQGFVYRERQMTQQWWGDCVLTR